MKIVLFIMLVIMLTSCNDQTTPGNKPQTAIAGDSATRAQQPPSDRVIRAGATSNGQPATVIEPPATSNSNLACLLTEINYCSSLHDSLHKYLPGWNIIWNPGSVNGNHAFLATNGTSYALSIRGSVIGFNEDAFNNWIRQDLNVAEQVAWPYSGNAASAVSAGTFTAWSNIALMKDGTGKTLLKMLDSLCRDQTPLLITGHSLGGNLATVVATWIDEHFKKQNTVHPEINVITFAAPAAGNTVFAEDFNSRFPHSIRYENSNDIVPKFPVAERVAALQQLFKPGPDATKIKVGYAFLKVSLSSIFTGIQVTLGGLAIRPGYSAYMQTNGNGTILRVALSGKNIQEDAAAWFAEAGFQHSAEQYAGALGIPVIHTP